MSYNRDGRYHEPHFKKHHSSRSRYRGDKYYRSGHHSHTKRRRSSYSREEYHESKERKFSVSVHRSPSSDKKSEVIDLYKPGWVEEIQKESIQLQNEALKLPELEQMTPQENNANKENQNWIKKRGIDYLREEFRKAEYFKAINPDKANAEVLNVSLQPTVKLTKILNLLEMTKLMLDEVL
ncbi:unnamed protein product [Moneuplotes crassus]|uniref:Uncharacterized protein n=2 Tax=Euplotes crassus TaxID=5936 RepID=A0AAD2D4D1_EUPCR|nr:unnamed protein product [Moneuplotes crassus]